MTEYEKSLWMKEYDRCRNSGDSVLTACKVADEAVREISKRMGKPEKEEPSGSVKLAADVYKWEGRQLYVMVNGEWEFAAQAWDDGSWMTYRPNSEDEHGGDSDDSGDVSTVKSQPGKELHSRAKAAAMLALDWESYGLKRPGGL